MKPLIKHQFSNKFNATAFQMIISSIPAILLSCLLVSVSASNPSSENHDPPLLTLQQRQSLGLSAAAGLTTPIATIPIDDADLVLRQLVDDVKGSVHSFEERSQAVMSKVNMNDRNSQPTALSSTSLFRDLIASEEWSYFSYNCACKVAVPIFRVQSCERAALLQITGFLATGDSYRAYANDQLILETPRVRALGVLTESFDPSSALLSSDWSHGEVPIEARTDFVLKITPSHATYEWGLGAVRLLPLSNVALNSRLFIVTNYLPWEQAGDACAAYGASLAVLHSERQVKEVALALNKLQSCPSVWLGGFGCKKPKARMYLLYNPVAENAVVDRVSRHDVSLRNVLCVRAKH